MHSLLIICCLFLSLTFSVALRRIYYHPLSSFPGPRLAAATSLYKVYYEVIRGGEFLNQIHELHKKYGTAIRTGPNELHFNDPRAYNHIYSFKQRYPKESTFYRCFGVDHSTFGTVNHHKSKQRRDILGSMFSRRTVLELEDTIQEHIDSLIHKLAVNRGPSNVFLAFRCATLDIITFYCFGRDLGALESEGFAHPLLVAIQATAPFFWLVKTFPWLLRLLLCCPATIARYVHNHVHSHVAVRQQICELISLAVQSSTSTEETKQKPTIYRQLLSKQYSSTLLSPVSSPLDETLSLLQAGSDTVGNTCTVGTFNILNNPAVHKKLVQELTEAWPDDGTRVPLAVLQRLPYLTAVIKESLRLSHGFVSPLPRIVNVLDRKVAGFSIPLGTTVGMSVTALHYNNAIFPDPNTFSPERWIGPDSKALDRFLAPFSKGPRMCLGINLAWVELYLIFGNVFRRLELETHCSSHQDFNKFKDYFIPIYQGGHPHVRVTRRSM